MRVRFCGDVITQIEDNLRLRFHREEQSQSRMSVTYSQMELSAPQSVINDDYKLSLKHFINKDFNKSYALIAKLHECCYRNFERSIISEKLFIKIINLYLTQVGMLFCPLEPQTQFHLPTPEKKALTESIRQNKFWTRLESFYGNAKDVPIALVYQVFLLNYACNKETKLEPKSILDQFDNVYSSLEFETETESDKEYLKRFAELYVYKVLPEAGEFDLALKLLQENPVLDPEQAKKRLNIIKETQIREKELLKKATEERAVQDRAKKAAETESREKEKRESNLRYRSLKHIRQSREKEIVGTSQLGPSQDATTIKMMDQWIAKARFLIQFSNTFVQRNYLALLVALVIALVTRRFTRVRNLNLLEKFQETVRMAFKVTYL